MGDYREQEIADLSAKIIAHLRTDPSDIEVKMAALRSAASAIENAISAKAQLAVMHNILNGPKR